MVEAEFGGGDLDLILLGYRSSMQSSSLYSPFELVYGVKARLPIELDLPTHTFQQDEHGNHMEMLMENLKILGDKRSNAQKNIQQAQATQKRQYMIENTIGKESLKLEMKYGYANSRRDQERVVN